jgi:hypothetical protein
MTATELVYRHQTFLHQMIVGAAFLTYLLQPDDIVWWLVKDRLAPHGLKRTLFVLATLLIAVGATICTKAWV